MNAAHPIDELARWSVRQRFVFIEQRLYWEGQLNRGDLTHRFAISPPQASADIARYMEAAPGSIEYDSSLKTYVPASSFAPRYMQPDARKYLTQLLLLADDAITTEESWLGFLPAHDAITRVRRRLDASTLRPIVLAVHRQRAIQILYQSMSSPEPVFRWIAPHALAFDGARWHVRAWCYSKSMFNDFVLARVLGIGDEDKEGSVDASLDRAWHDYVTLRLGPHPDLSPAQKRVVELDYGMEDGVIAIPMRLCLSYYFERHYGLDLPENLLPSVRRQVVLLNRAEVDALRESA